MTFYDYGEDGDKKRYRELYTSCCFYCKEALAKRLGHANTGKLKRKEYKKALEALLNNWEEILDEICDRRGKECLKKFCHELSREDDFRFYAKRGMEIVRKELKEKINTYNI